MGSRAGSASWIDREPRVEPSVLLAGLRAAVPFRWAFRSRPAVGDVVRTGAQLVLAAAVALAAWWGVAGPRGTGGFGADRLEVVTVGVGGLNFVVLAVAAGRSRGAVRVSVGILAVADVFWTVSYVGALQGWSAWVVWGALRLPGSALGGASVMASPGVRRSRADWGLLLLEGWLLAGSAAEITWVALRFQGHTLQELFARHSPALGWTGMELTTAIVVSGLVLRMHPAHRGAVGFLAAACLLSISADLAWAATGDPRAGIPLLLTSSGFLCAVCLNPTLDVWSGSVPGPNELRLSRPAPVAAVPGLLAATVGRPDVLVIGLAASLLAVLSLEILIWANAMRTVWARAQSQADRLDTVLRESRDAIVMIRPCGRVDYANPATEDVFGHPPQELVGTRLSDHVHPHDVARLRKAVDALERGGDPIRILGRFGRAGESWRHVEATASRRVGAEQDGIIVVARDVEERVRLEAELRAQAETDALTGLLNRQAFLTALDANLNAGPTAVLFCDLDGFKAVNDTDGHAAGDVVLCWAAETVLRTVHPGQLVARLGGDEFAVLVPAAAVAAEVAAEMAAGVVAGAAAGVALDAVQRAAEEVAEALVASLARRGHDGPLGVSIGLAVSAGRTPGPGAHGGPDHGQELLRDADLAMFEAKAAGGGTWVRFQPEMRERVVARLQLQADLERAIAADGLSIDLQPIVDVRTGDWAQFEALVRWPDGERRRPPAEFLPLAQETGLMVPLGAWVLRASLAWLAQWPDAEAGISVNVTGAQVMNPGFVDMVRAELDRHGVAPERLTLEITEQTAVEDLDRAGEVLQPLRALGVHVALDDFGTGYCSLGYLAQLPVDEVKIDRQFVGGLGRRPQDDALVRAVLGLASDLGLRVVAEGVETAEQAQILADYGCPLLQGFRYARPVPAGRLRPGTGPWLPASTVPLPRRREHSAGDAASAREANPPERV